MNRRNFFKMFGSAILGTAIALKIPDVLVPMLEIPRDRGTPISWSVLNNAFKKAMQKSPEPSFLILPRWAIEYSNKYKV